MSNMNNYINSKINEISKTLKMNNVKSADHFDIFNDFNMNFGVKLDDVFYANGMKSTGFYLFIEKLVSMHLFYTLINHINAWVQYYK